MLVLDKQHVLAEKFTQGYKGPLDANVQRKIFSEGMSAVTENGILGDSRAAKAEYGGIFLDRLVDFLYAKISRELTKDADERAVGVSERRLIFADALIRRIFRVEILKRSDQLLDAIIL